LKRIAYLLLATAVIVLDIITKQWILANFAIHESRVIIENFFNIVHVRNTGAAFGIGASTGSSLVPLLLHGGAIIVLIVVLVYSFRTDINDRLLQTALNLIIGGAIGNIIDRFRFGSVVDFLDVFIVLGGRERHWPAFNVADSAICIGIALLFVDMMKKPATTKVSA